MQEVTFYERGVAIIAGLTISLSLSSLAYMKGYFTKLIPNRNIPLAFTDVISVLLMLLLVRMLIAPATFVVMYTLMTGETLNQAVFTRDPALQGYFNIIVVTQLLICYGFYLYVLRPQLRPLVFGKSQNPPYDIALGIVSWIIAYPWVFTASQAVETVTNYFSPNPPIEQEAIQFMRALMSHPILLVVSTLLVSVIIPIIEEIVFRGFLQQWLKRFFHPLYAILVTAIAFAFAHFSTIQGLSNLPIIAALFVLSLFLGYLRERQGNLLAPIALHATVNTVTLTIILLQEHFHESYQATLGVLSSFFLFIR